MRNREADAKFEALIKSLIPEDELFKIGRQQAILSCATKRIPEDLQYLADYASAIALDNHTSPFDATLNEHDLLMSNEYEKHLHDRASVEMALGGCVRPRVRENEALFAKKKKDLTEPKLSLVITVAAILVISLSVAPTLHDRLFLELSNVLLAWAISITGAGFIATLITWSLVGAIDVTGKRSFTNVGGLIAGMGMSIGIGVLRLADAQSLNEFIFAIALTLVEIFTVAFLEWLAIGLRANYREWKEYQKEIIRAFAELEAAQADLARWENELSTLNQKINHHIAYVEERWMRHNNVDEIERIALKIIIEGYDKGIFENTRSGSNLIMFRPRNDI